MATSKLLKILLVEDEPIARFTILSFLTNMGYSPDVAESGQQALSLINNQYDVIFMDIGLPDTDGIEVTKMIREIEGSKNSACIIALTAYIQDKELISQCLSAGMNDIAGKPISKIELQTLIDKYLSKNKHW